MPPERNIQQKVHSPMNLSLPIVFLVALVQGFLLHGLHRLAEGSHGAWSELFFLLPAYAVTVGIPLTFYLLRTHIAGTVLVLRLSVLALALAVCGAYVGWVNGPVGEMRPVSDGSVFLYTFLTLLAWFVALPFLRFGVRDALETSGYSALFDDAWRLVVTLAFAVLFVGLFWGLLSLFVALFESIGIDWPKEIIYERYFVYPVTCIASSFAIGFTDVKPETFRGLRRVLLTLLRWLAPLTALIVLLFLGALIVQGVDALWKTRFAAGGLISLSLALIVFYNTVYQDGTETDRLPRVLRWLLRTALLAGPALAVLGFWALGLRVLQHGLSEDRLYALLVLVILAGYLAGYWIVALRSGKAPFAIRQVNVVMALAIVAVLVAVHTPLLDFKRLAVSSQLGRLDVSGDKFDYVYLRHDAGRHGVQALQQLTQSDDAKVLDRAKLALSEANRREYGPLARGQGSLSDKARFNTRIEVYPKAKVLPEALSDVLFTTYTKDRFELSCIDSGSPCALILIDLDGDSRDEAVVVHEYWNYVYAQDGKLWVKIGQLQSYNQLRSIGNLRQDLMEGRLQVIPIPRFRGIEIGAARFTFVPASCKPKQTDCVED